VDLGFEAGATAVSPRLWRARQALWAVIAIPVIIAASVLTWVAAGTTAGVSVLAGTGLLALVWLGLLRGRARSWRYLEREDDLLVARGLLFRRVSVVPYGRMQFVDVTAGPVERSFGLATVQLHTAAAATNARIPGLERAEAWRLRDQLAALGEARSSGL
jgi:membrane protein YdbS with pleckstrin-like domain